MPTITEHLGEIIRQKSKLAENLTTKGVPAESSEKLNTLVPKVLEIASMPEISAEDVRYGATIGNVAGTFSYIADDSNASSSAIREGKIAFVNGEQVTGTMPTLEGKEIVPGNEDITFWGQGYLRDNVVVKGDANLVPSNIKQGVVIFGIEGTMTSEGGVDTSDATATSDDILKGKTAYVNGQKITGTLDAEMGTTEFELINTSEFTSREQTLSVYGDSVLISEDGGSTFNTLLETYTKYTVDDHGDPLAIPPDDNFVSANPERECGIMMDTWVGESSPTSILFTTPVYLKTSPFIIGFYCSLNAWTNVIMRVHLYKPDGATKEEKIADVKRRIAEGIECRIHGDVFYPGSSSKISIYMENRALTPETQIDPDEYYLYIDGFTNKNNTNMTLIRIRFLDI